MEREFTRDGERDGLRSAARLHVGGDPATGEVVGDVMRHHVIVIESNRRARFDGKDSWNESVILDDRAGDRAERSKVAVLEVSRAAKYPVLPLTGL